MKDLHFDFMLPGAVMKVKILALRTNLLRMPLQNGKNSDYPVYKRCHNYHSPRRGTCPKSIPGKYCALSKNWLYPLKEHSLLEHPKHERQ